MTATPTPPPAGAPDLPHLSDIEHPMQHASPDQPDLPQWKIGNEFAQFHPSASHIDPSYRDGWNACYKAAIIAQPPQSVSVPDAVSVLRSIIHDGYLSDSNTGLGHAVLDAIDAHHAAALPKSQADAQACTELNAIYDFMGFGSQARYLDTLLANLRNMRHFADLLHAVEREFFMVTGELNEDYPNEAPDDECLLNCWGSTEAEYIEQFRAALVCLGVSAPPQQGEGSIDSSEFRKLTFTYAQAILHGSVPDSSAAWAALVNYIDSARLARTAAPELLNIGSMMYQGRTVTDWVITAKGLINEAAARTAAPRTQGWNQDDDKQFLGLLAARTAAPSEPLMADGKTKLSDYLENAIPEDTILDDWTKGYEECRRRLFKLVGAQLRKLVLAPSESQAIPTDLSKLALAIEALELADGVMSYCQGDAWERECTESDRTRFQEIYEQFFPPAPPQEVTGYYSHYSLQKKRPRVACPICKKKYGGTDGLWEHSKTIHNYTGSRQAFEHEFADIAKKGQP